MPHEQYFVGKGGLAPEKTLAALTDAITLGLNFKSREQFCSPSDAVAPESAMAQSLPEDPQPLSAILEELRTNYLPGFPNFGSTRFLGFPDAGNSVAGIAGAILADLINVNLINSTFCSRLATEIEISVLTWMRRIVGYPAYSGVPQDATEVGGMVLSGGTMSNYTATLIARERAFPETLTKGVYFDPSRVKVIVPEGIAHYTMAASMSWAGLGSQNIIRCPTEAFRYDKTALRRLLLDARANQDRVIMLVAYAGDSRTMTIEDLRGVHDLVREIDKDIWLHCDGCHGTTLCFSDALKGKVAGIELWDSVTLDPHKVLAVPYPLSIFLLKEPASVKCILTASDLIMRQRTSLGQTTPVLGSKAFHSLRLWMLLKHLGVRQLGEVIENRCKQALEFAEFISADKSFVLLNEVGINSVVFAYVPEGVAVPSSLDSANNISLLNRRIYERILSDGFCYIHSFVLPDHLNVLGQGPDFQVNVLRYMCGNPLTKPADMRDCIEYIRGVGEQCQMSNAIA